MPAEHGYELLLVTFGSWSAAGTDQWVRVVIVSAFFVANIGRSRDRPD